MANPLFERKPLALLLEEMKGENRLRRILGPVTLTSLGVGAIIGTGIFVLTGVGAHDKAGPALILSFGLAGVACVFAALCYAEFASMVPVAGSAYTYAYATLGELFAWIIGWDLVLEYAVGSSTVAHGWSAHFKDLMGSLGIHVPFAFSSAPFDFDPDKGRFFSTGAYFDVTAILITIVITAILVKGIRESAGFNAAMVSVKLVIVLFVIVVGVFYINPKNWIPFAPYGYTGVSFFGHTLFGQTGLGGAPLGRPCRSRDHLFCLYRIRFRLHSCRRGQKTATRCSHRDHRFADYLHCSIYRGFRDSHRHGSLRSNRHQRSRRRCLSAKGVALGSTSHRHRRDHGNHFGIARHDA